MSDTAQLQAPEAQPDTEALRSALLAALRVAHARAKLVILDIEDIGAELKAGRLTPLEAMRFCINLRLDALFPRESDGG